MLRPARASCAVLPLVTALLCSCSTTTSKPLPEYQGGKRTISEGYSLLYFAVSEEKWTDKILLVKFESDDLERVIHRISKYAAQLKVELEDLARRYPAIRLEPPPPSEIEQRARHAQTDEQTKSLLSESGKKFERDLLLAQLAVLDQLRSLAAVMIEAETDANRRAFWNEVHDEFEAQYREVVRLLEREHF